MKIYHYTSMDYRLRANSAYLICSYLIIYKKQTAEQAWSLFENVEPKFVPYRDAIYGECTYECTIFDCLKGLELGMKLNWYNPSTFNLKEYEEYERVDNGDLNWIIPGKFVAFSSPSKNQYDTDGVNILSFYFYLYYFSIELLHLKTIALYLRNLK